MLVLLAAVAAAARAEGIELVDEKDAGRALRGLLEERAHALRSSANEDLGWWRCGGEEVRWG